MTDREVKKGRPLLLYGIAVVIIAAAALYLFWPRSKEHTPGALTFTPQGSEPSAVAEGSAGATPAASGSGGQRQTRTDLGDVPPPSESEPSPGELHPAEPAGAAARTGAAAARGTASAELSTAETGEIVAANPTRHAAASTQPFAKPPRTGPTGIRTGPAQAEIVPTPGTTGAYLVWLGSFQNQENARKRVSQLAEAGFDGVIVPVDMPNAGRFYRVRVGFFRDVKAAQMFGDAMAKRFEITYWVDSREPQR
jgi:cell division septation protein DedD